MIIGLCMETRHCLKLGSVTTVALLNKNPREGHAWVQDRLTKKQVTTRPGKYIYIYMDEWSNMSNSAQRKAIHKWAEAKPQLDGARDRRGIYSVPDGDPECEETMNNASRKNGDKQSSAMPCKVTKPANPNGSSWGRPCASDWFRKLQRKG